MRERMPDAVFTAVMERARWHCEARTPACQNHPVQWHHRRMRSQLGRHEVVNGLAVCPACHGWIHAHPADSYASGWLVRSTEEPGETPVRWRGRRAMLTDAGQVLLGPTRTACMATNREGVDPWLR